jgi:hypothetical protein
LVDKSQSDADEREPIDLAKEDVDLICDLITGDVNGRTESNPSLIKTVSRALDV